MYYSEGSVRGCSYSNLNAVLHKDVTLTKENRKRVVCEFFRLEEGDLAISVRRVVAVMCANEFFLHVYDKSILDAKPKEMAALKECKDRYEAWRPSAKKVTYEELVKTIQFLETNLR